MSYNVPQSLERMNTSNSSRRLSQRLSRYLDILRSTPTCHLRGCLSLIFGTYSGSLKRGHLISVVSDLTEHYRTIGDSSPTTAAIQYLAACFEVSTLRCVRHVKMSLTTSSPPRSDLALIALTLDPAHHARTMHTICQNLFTICNLVVKDIDKVDTPFSDPDLVVISSAAINRVKVFLDREDVMIHIIVPVVRQPVFNPWLSSQTHSMAPTRIRPNMSSQSNHTSIETEVAQGLLLLTNGQQRTNATSTGRHITDQKHGHLNDDDHAFKFIQDHDYQID